MKNILIIGASHGIGESLAFEYACAKDKNNLFLAARDFESLLAIKKQAKNDNIEIFSLDVTNEENAKKIIENINQIDIFIYCAGTYKPMEAVNIDLSEAKKINEVNFVGALNCLDPVIKKMLKQKSGQIAIVASVAGYIGLPKSLAYGASKAALINLAETLHAELSFHNIHVSVINPGFVKTRLTDLNKFKMPAIITTEKAAKIIIKGLESKKFEIVFPKRFTIWLKILRILPYKLVFFFTKKLLNN